MAFTYSRSCSPHEVALLYRCEKKKTKKKFLIKIYINNPEEKFYLNFFFLFHYL